MKCLPIVVSTTGCLLTSSPVGSCSRNPPPEGKTFFPRGKGTATSYVDKNGALPMVNEYQGEVFKW